MRRINTLILVALLSGCDYGVQWRDKPYAVQWIDTQENRALVWDMGGSSIGRVPAKVIAVGSNSKYVVAKRVSGGELSYYYLVRAKDSKYSGRSDAREGPFFETEYQTLKRQLGLPEFSKEFRH